MREKLFYVASLTWGLPMSFIGILTASILICLGYKPIKYGHCYYFSVGKSWGGLSLGFICIVSKTASEHTYKHEHGHAIQNCIYGFLMPFLVNIPSAIRFWYREFKYKNSPCSTPYDGVWYEAQATEWGTKFFN